MPLKLSKAASKAPTKPTAEITKELTEKGSVVATENLKEEPELDMQSPKQAGVPWCTVGFAAGYTHNLGNYQSARVDILLLVPCEHAEIDQVYGVAEKWVNDKLQAVITDMTSD